MVKIGYKCTEDSNCKVTDRPRERGERIPFGGGG